MNQLGSIIRKKRRAKQLSQKELALLTHSSQSTIAKMENGLNLRVEMLYLIADALDCTAIKLLSESEDNDLCLLDSEEFLNFCKKNLVKHTKKESTQSKLLKLINELITDYLKEINHGK